jgi:hypothetical protein
LVVPLGARLHRVDLVLEATLVSSEVVQLGLHVHRLAVKLLALLVGRRDRGKFGHMVASVRELYELGVGGLQVEQA